MRLKEILWLIITLIIGFGVPYLVQFKWDFLGANHITIKDIVGLWIGFPFFTLIMSAYLHLELSKTKR